MSDPTTCDDHTPMPENYAAWHQAAEKLSKTHRQLRCDECGLWEIWADEGSDRE